MKKFTFKTEKPTGKFKSFYPSCHYIKLDGKQVGEIVDETWKIRLMIVKQNILEDKNPNCTWKWICLAKQPTSLQDAKDFLNSKIEVIIRNFNLYKSEE